MQSECSSLCLDRRHCCHHPKVHLTGQKAVPSNSEWPIHRQWVQQQASRKAEQVNGWTMSYSAPRSFVQVKFGAPIFQVNEQKERENKRRVIPSDAYARSSATLSPVGPALWPDHQSGRYRPLHLCSFIMHRPFLLSTACWPFMQSQGQTHGLSRCCV